MQALRLDTFSLMRKKTELVTQFPEKKGVRQLGALLTTKPEIA